MNQLVLLLGLLLCSVHMNIQGPAKDAICDLHHVSPAIGRRKGTLSRAYRSLLTEQAICQKFPMLVHDSVISSVKLLLFDRAKQEGEREEFGQDPCYGLTMEIVVSPETPIAGRVEWTRSHVQSGQERKVRPPLTHIYASIRWFEIAETTQKGVIYITVF